MDANELMTTLRLRNVFRWGVVNMARRQSVAEHSFLVWAIGMRLYHGFRVRENTPEEAALTLKLLLHDVDEALLGDLPSNVKAELERVAPGALQRACSACGAGIGLNTGHWTDDLVSMADTTEAMLFALDNGAPADVLRFLQNKLDEIYIHAEKMNSTQFQWDAALAAIRHEILGAPLP